MKKSRKLLCVLLAAVMIFSMLSVMAFAADEDVAAEESVAASVEENSPETAGVISDALGNIFTNLPNYLVVVKTPWGCRTRCSGRPLQPEQGRDRCDCRRHLWCRGLRQEGSFQRLQPVRYLDAGIYRHAV